MAENERLKKVIFWLISQDMATTQEDVAKKVGINPGYLSQLVSGIRPISNKFIKTLCKKFDKLNSRYVLGNEGEISEVTEPIKTESQPLPELPSNLIMELEIEKRLSAMKDKEIESLKNKLRESDRALTLSEAKQEGSLSDLMQDRRKAG